MRTISKYIFQFFITRLVSETVDSPFEQSCFHPAVNQQKDRPSPHRFLPFYYFCEEALKTGKSLHINLHATQDGNTQPVLLNRDCFIQYGVFVTGAVP